MAGRAAAAASLLSLYLKHDRLLEAADLVLSHFQALAAGPLTQHEATAKGTCAVWLPHSIIRNLLGRLGELAGRERDREQDDRGRGGAGLGAPSYGPALEALEAAVRQYVDVAESRSGLMLSQAASEAAAVEAH